MDILTAWNGWMEAKKKVAEAEKLKEEAFDQLGACLMELMGGLMMKMAEREAKFAEDEAFIQNIKKKMEEGLN